ncbi:cyclic nucleotide-binding domain-containing protein [Brevibacillus fluminis]|uniref:cyclic nucleotide-binding domain-containing protein n=1 Tax=Brevibacillus fluminis TaxID=511487 RepID=UPI003F8B09F3
MTDKQLEHPYFQYEAFRSFFALEENLQHSQEFIGLLQKFTRLDYNDGDVIFREGDVGDSFYLIERGNVEIIKESEQRKVINSLQTGDYFGELALITGNRRATSVECRGETTVFRLSKTDFEKLTVLYPRIHGILLNKLYDHLKGSYIELEKKSKELEVSFHERVQLGFIFISMVLGISLYSFVIRIFQGNMIQGEYAELINFTVTRTLDVAALLVIVSIVVKSSLPMSSFGLTFTNSKRAVIEAVGVSLVAMVVLTGVKWFSQKNGFNWFGDGPMISFSLFDWTYVTYLVVAPLQEFIARGVLQSSIERLIARGNQVLWAVLVTSIIFGAMHLHTSVKLAVAAILTSWLWGWMYTRHRNIVGVGLSHFIIGNYAGLLGFWSNL